MEFTMIQKEIQLQSRGWVPTFHDITIDIHKMVQVPLTIPDSSTIFMTSVEMSWKVGIQPRDCS